MRIFKNICFTAFSTDDRQELAEQAQKLGLIVCNNFENSTDVLVAGRVGTEKYRLALKTETPVVKSDWITSSAKSGRLLDIDAFKVPALFGCMVCVTGLNTDNRLKVQQLCEQNGAIYNSSLLPGYTHLIAKKRGSEKFEFALKNNTNVVTIKWIEDSVKRKCAQDESQYFLQNLTEEEKKQCNENLARFQFKSTKEDIDDDSSVEYIEPIKSILPTQFTGKAETMESDISPSQYSLEDTELSLFNGVMFYFVGFDSTIESRRLIRKYGGNATLTLLATINYIIVNDANTELCKHTINDIMKKISYEPPVLIFKWIIDCIERLEIIPIDNYVLNPPNYSVEGNIKADAPLSLTMDISDEDLAEAFKSQPTNGKNDNETAKEVHVPSFSQLTPSCTVKLFTSYTFQLSDYLGISGKQAKIIIERNGGIITKNSDYNFIIFPELCNIPRVTNERIRTMTWLRDCETANILKPVDDSIFYRPSFRLVMDGIKPKNENTLLIVLSGFQQEREKTLLQNIIDIIGAKSSKNLNKKLTDVLVCKSESEKYHFAKTSGIPIVTDQWLIDTYKFGYFPSPDQYKFQPLADTSTSTTPEKPITNPPIQPPKTPLLITSITSKSYENTTPTNNEPNIRIIDENARDVNSPEKTPEGKTSMELSDLTPSSFTKSKLLDKLPKKKTDRRKTNILEEETSKEKAFVSKKNLETLGYYASQNTNHDSNSGSFSVNSLLDSEYNEKVKKDRHRFTNFEHTINSTLLETQVVEHDDQSYKHALKLESIKPEVEKHFLFSSVGEDTKQHLTELITKLGGHIDSKFISGTTTHLVMQTPSSTEKFLCAVAGGCYIVPPSYIEVSYNQVQWVDERDHQWGTYRGSIPENDPLLNHLRAAIHIRESKKLPFQGMVALFNGCKDSYRRVLEAGGAKIAKKNVTHVFIGSDMLPKTKALQEKFPDAKILKEEDINNLLANTPDGSLEIESSVKKRSQSSRDSESPTPETKKRKSSKRK